MKGDCSGSRPSCFRGPQQTQAMSAFLTIVTVKVAGCSDSESGRADSDSDQADSESGRADSDSDQADSESGRADPESDQAESGRADPDSGRAESGPGESGSGRADPESGRAESGRADPEYGRAESGRVATDFAVLRSQRGFPKPARRRKSAQPRRKCGRNRALQNSCVVPPGIEMIRFGSARDGISVSARP
jgi:hypothetical protein